VGEDRGSKETDGCPLTGIKVLGALLDPVIDITEDRLYSTNSDLDCSLARHLGVHQIKADQ
jgi:hypothetical protein